MNEDERRALGASCRAFIQRHYSVDRMVESQLAVYEKLTDYRTGGDPDVLLCGYYGYGNLGDETLLSVIIRELRRRKPSVRICVLSANPRKTAAYHMVDAVNRFDFSGIERKMKKTKLFMFGGGSLLQDRTSNRSLSYYIHMLRLAKKNGVKIAIFANGIGPILREKNKKRVHDVLSLSDMLSLRDSRSWEFCKSCCSDKNPRLTFDPAILVSDEMVSASAGDFFVVIPKRTIPDSGEKLKNAVLHIKKNRGLRPVFVSLFAAEDRGYAENLAHDCDAECISFSDAEACISYLSQARFLVSSRLHGLVYATAACLPMLAFTDDTKLLSYMETIGLGERGEFSLVYHVKSDESLLSERLDELLGGEGAIRAHLRNNLSAWREMAQREFDEMIRLLN
jgi:polysaccharide pyruvyl transferase CsaB